MSTPANNIPVEQESQNTESLTTQTSPVEQVQQNKQTTSVIDPNEQRFSILQDTIRQQNERINQLIELANKPVPQPVAPKDPEKEKAAFFNNPTGTVQEIVQKELKEAIKPLQEFVSGFKAENSYDRLKRSIDPALATQLKDPAIETAVDQIMLSGTIQINADNLRAAIVQVVGMKNLGLLPGSIPNQQQTQPASATGTTAGNTMVNPPYLRPSNPPMPGNSTGKQNVRQLTENERRLAKENGMTPEQYLQWLEIDPNTVASSQIGRDKK